MSVEVTQKLLEKARRRIKRKLANPETKVPRVRIDNNNDIYYIAKHHPKTLLRFKQSKDGRLLKCR